MRRSRSQAWMPGVSLSDCHRAVTGGADCHCTARDRDTESVTVRDSFRPSDISGPRPDGRAAASVQDAPRHPTRMRPLPRPSESRVTEAFRPRQTEAPGAAAGERDGEQGGVRGGAWGHPPEEPLTPARRRRRPAPARGSRLPVTHRRHGSLSSSAGRRLETKAHCQ